MPLVQILQATKRHRIIIKRVLQLVPFFCVLPPGIAYANCASDYYDEIVQIGKVHDGDTLKLTDGRKLRIIGLNTPEHARDEKPAEPYAMQATQTLKQLIDNQHRIKLRYGAEKRDHYGRLLSHVFLNDGRNITELMLKKGMGLALVIPPNLWNKDCYQQAEQTAQQAQTGLWQHPRYQAIDVLQLESHYRGYYRVKGTVQRISKSRSAYWLALSENFALKIKKSDSHYFNSLPIESLKGTTLIARGWIYERPYKNRNQKRMRIHHPDALDVVK